MLITLKNVRLAFSQFLFTKGTNLQNAEPNFSCTLIIDKKDSQIQAVRKVIAEVAKEQWKDKSIAILKQLNAKESLCLRDGDLKTDYAGFEDTMYISCNAKTRPTIVDKDRSPLVEEDGKPYAGCYVNAKLDIWAQDNNYGKRVNASLRGIQFAGDGEAFGGCKPASADEFDDLSDTGDDLTGDGADF